MGDPTLPVAAGYGAYHHPNGMTRRNTTLVSALVIVGAVSVAVVLRVHEASAASSRRIASAAVRVESERAARDRALAFYLSVARGDSTSSMAFAKAGALQLQRARENGNFSDIIGAEELARRSLRILPSNEDAALTLTSGLMAEHRFREAIDVARGLLANEPGKASHRALVAEILLELGDYDLARPIFDSLQRGEMNLTVSARVARWLELTGRSADARRIIQRAGEQAIRLDHLPREQVAWYYLRMGDLQLRDGHVQRAERAYMEGLLVVPDDYRLHAGLARLFANQHRWRAAIEHAEASIALVLDPASLAVLSDAYRAVGDSAKAAEFDAALDVAFLHQPGPFHRAMSLYLLDRGKHVREVLAKAEEEIATRRDPYGYDVLAWALHANGRDDDARAAMRAALRFGTVDANMLFHAGVIERALGNANAARQFLARSLRVNPQFHSAHPSTARAMLDSIGAVPE